MPVTVILAFYSREGQKTLKGRFTHYGSDSTEGEVYLLYIEVIYSEYLRGRVVDKRLCLG